uniref:Uncharacterized protein n=2 Tax=Kalanchoe fedtschenkoi TaxID=63787 RepID=A0A7N0T7T2_KALFE
MSSNFPLPTIFLLLFFIPLCRSQSRGTFIDCGSTVDTLVDGRLWEADTHYISAGTPQTLSTPVTSPILSTLRTFPLQNYLNRKFCYVFSVYRTGRYLLRTTYYYGGGTDIVPPVFDQVVDGTIWGLVNTTDDYASGNASYYEGVFEATGNTMSLCVAPNALTDSDPFISALEFVMLDWSVYNTTNFQTNGLRLVARHNFGYTTSITRFPDDPFDRFWEPFTAGNLTATSTTNVSTSGFWNLPPPKIFETSIAQSQPIPLDFQWPSVSLPNSTYYIALYFADDRDVLSSSTGSRMFSVKINGVMYYESLNLSPDGSAVFSTRWPLFGFTKISLTPTADSDLGPLINGGEVFEVFPLGRKTHTRDVIALENIKSTLLGYPLDWNGDPCMPRQYAWTGITCSEGTRIRVISLNLTSVGVSGSLSPNIANLTALTDLWLGDNNLTGPIPDISSLKRLQKLHLENNQFSGEIPQSLVGMTTLTELFLQNNNLTGEVPNGLERPGLTLKLSPGNNFSSPPPI